MIILEVKPTTPKAPPNHIQYGWLVNVENGIKIGKPFNKAIMNNDKVPIKNETIEAIKGVPLIRFPKLVLIEVWIGKINPAIIPII